MSNYFPMSLIKTVELDPEGKFIFGYHPHGIISLGAFVCFGTEARDVSTVFPGIDIRVLTLSTNFIIPLWRDIVLGLGFCSVSKKSINSLLNSGKSCMIGKFPITY
jgi:2-acylglycerol O-acyltransferase 2